MENSSKITDLMTKIQFFSKSKEINRAISLMVEYSEQVDLSPDLLVEKGRLIQLSSDDVNLTLDDAFVCFKKALDINEHHLGALSELGWHYLNIEDDAKKAKPYFELALKDVCDLKSYVEIYKGAIDCLVELNGVESAIKEIKSNGKISEKQKNIFISYLNDSDGVVFWD